MPSNYSKLLKRATWAAMSVAIILFIAKTLVWWQTGSVTLLASVVDSLLDFMASLSSLLIVRYSLQPADDDHSFGHGKAESLAALAQSTFIAGSAFFLIINAIQHAFHQQTLQRPELGVMVSVFAFILTLALVIFQKHVIAKTQSQAIAADCLHYQSDLYMNAAIGLALVLSSVGYPQADIIFGILIGIYIVYGATKIAYQAVQSLLDHRLPDSDIEKINQIAVNVDQVNGIHQLRTRQSGETKFIQLHLELNANMTLFQAHAITNKVEAALLAEFKNADIIIHQDPFKDEE